MSLIRPFCQITKPIWLIALAVIVTTGGFSGSLLAQSKADTDGTKGAKNVRALLVTGGCCHDYQNQKQIISDALSEKIGDIDWTILHYGDKREIEPDIYKSGDWIEGYDIVIHNECFGGVTDGDFVNGIVDAHLKSKVPAIVVHCSMHSYRKAPTADAWRSLLGVTSVRHEKKKHPLDVVPTDAGKSDPILAGMGDKWTTPNGELYIIENVWPTAKVLATVYSQETKKDEPVIWKNEINGTRVFGISLGHHNETMQDPKWKAILANGWKWAVE
ncbi:ThuA domain-containing protein [Planctomycetes bacterium K23_9]|uniref:Trehalose utilization n=1 Tax=Stieleria marina TaxID=1930275 RepID=A0A517NPW4_9BACT|nr:Trehalose utilization [Planctomycetes bacterium K23_9]